MHPAQNIHWKEKPMKRFYMRFALIVLGFLAFPTNADAGEAQNPADKTLSPYFFVKSEDPTVDQLPLQSTSVQVDIAGVIADVKVTQIYKNEGKKALEALYVFPASTRAAVYGMKMTLGERTITAQIREREAARREYEEAREAGKSASLLEEQRPNVFQMNVANILPGDVIKVEMSYTEFLSPTGGVYEFIYPTVVGPRYANQPEATAPSSEKWVKSPYLHQGESPTYSFDIQVNLSTGIPLQDVACPSHQVTTLFDGPALATVKLAEGRSSSGNRDFILKYKLAGEKIASGLLLSKGETENFFLLMLQPPQRIKAEEIPPREFIFIVDVSGSMHGFPLDVSKKLVKNLLGNLRPTDRFNVLLFAGGSRLMADASLPATPENIERAIRILDEERGGGGTELLPALQRALALPKVEGSARSVVVVTDGYVNVETQSFDLIRNNLGKANLFAFGIGSSVNRFIIEGMARAGMGEPFIVTRPDEASSQAEKFRKYIESPLLTGIRLDFGGFNVYDTEPSNIPDVLAERPVTVFGKWRGLPRGEVVLEGRAGREEFRQKVDVGAVNPLEVNAPLRYLWARERIATLSDYNHLQPDDDRTAEVKELGLKYHLLTPYTSFVAVDTLVRRKDGEVTTVQQPLPLPEGVSDYAIGNAGPTAAPRSMALHEKYSRRPLPSPTPDVDKSGGKTEEIRIYIQGHSEEMTVTKGLSKESIEKVIENHLHEMERCYQDALAKQPGLQGKMTLKFVVDSKGRVRKVQFISSGWVSREFQTCIENLLKQWRFPPPSSGGKVEIVYPFTCGIR
jgi:Ca-activated chloride channel family protein